MLYLNAADFDDMVKERAASGIHPFTWLVVIALSLAMWAGFFYAVAWVIALF